MSLPNTREIIYINIFANIKLLHLLKHILIYPPLLNNATRALCNKMAVPNDVVDWYDDSISVMMSG